MDYTAEEILALVFNKRQQIEQEQNNPRELTSRAKDDNPREVYNTTRESDDFSGNPREVYKDKKIKREKDVSRETREEIANSCLSGPFGSASQEVSPEGLESQGGGNVITPRENYTSRAFTGITAQHVKTAKGIKVNLTLQTAQDAADGKYLDLTAELKRHDRLRELKRYAEDSYEFDQLYVQTISELKDLTPEEGKSICIGRVHDRGFRAKWYSNVMVVGTLDSAGKLVSVLINIENEEYDIKLDGILSPRQEELYHATGTFGELKTNKRAPSVHTAPRKSF